MPRKDKSAAAGKQRRQAGAVERSSRPRSAARGEAEARAWATANKLHSGGRNTASRRKLPSGQIGGSGRKTNLSRSS